MHWFRHSNSIAKLVAHLFASEFTSHMFRSFLNIPVFDHLTIFELCILVLVTRFNDFGGDGGPAAKELAPKLDLTKAHLSSRLGVALPNIEVWPRLLVA